MGLAVEEMPDRPDIDPHWKYAPGKQDALWPAASPKGEPTKGGGWSREVADHELDHQTCETLNLGNLTPKKATGRIMDDLPADLVKAVEMALGGKQMETVARCGAWEVPVVLDAKRLGGHLREHPDRAKFLGLLEDALQPQEMWAQFIQHEDKNGNPTKMSLKWRFVSSVDISGKKLALICEANSEGVLEAATFIPITEDRAINRHRVGRLVARH
jgi:hypothetical protein